MANARLQIDKALYSVLNVNDMLQDAPGGVWNTLAPPDTELPYVVFQAMTKDDSHSFNGRYSEMVYMVKAVSKSRWPKEAMDVDTQIDTLLEDATLSITGFSQLLCRRETDIYQPVTEAGQEYQQIGGMYRIIADQV
jgi:hypothetical protein